MRIALIADTFPPFRTSGALQLRDLSSEFVKQGHALTVILPTAGLNVPWLLEDFDGVRVLRLGAPKTKDMNYIYRTISEMVMPYFMLYNLRKSPFEQELWDGIVWYSPSIFFGFFVKALKKSSNCKAYLIIRDIFPEWAADIGIIGRGFAYRFFKSVANYQYSVADIIGIQSQGNYIYFSHLKNCQIEVLQNWLTDAPNVKSSISIDTTKLAGRTIFIYAGNLGVAQGMDVLIDLVELLDSRADIGFIFVGRGSEAQRLHADVESRSLSNVLFFDEIDPTEIPGLYKQCHVGIVALDARHKTHNIPGKFLSYMQAGLPVLASINPGNDLEEIILTEKVGRVCVDQSANTLYQLAIELVDDVVKIETKNKAVSSSCKTLFSRLFSPKVAVRQIVSALAFKD
ncbi:glycosyltransferase family 4 protein [Candidatus Methylopumilus planktonicus]|jgi:glycosyltransferase involved in cell wall biosynthesis|uniref:glycosyltransferase family 4 protein n=1 Tax=Candidatus Methylopumilus planktonicus TaxID=1581557 RepID=UPI003BEEF527